MVTSGLVLLLLFQDHGKLGYIILGVSFISILIGFIAKASKGYELKYHNLWILTLIVACGDLFSSIFFGFDINGGVSRCVLIVSFISCALLALSGFIVATPNARRR